MPPQVLLIVTADGAEAASALAAVAAVAVAVSFLGFLGWCPGRGAHRHPGGRAAPCLELIAGRRSLP
jgi:hypothetical protein